MSKLTLITALAATAAAFTLTACGGGGASDSVPVPAPTPAPAPVLFAIGNSITFIAPQSTADFTWMPGRGMAASALATDYVHVAAARLGIAVAAQRNVASLELPANDPVNVIDSTTPIGTQVTNAVAGIEASSDVVVELGDNAWTPSVAPAAPVPEWEAFVSNYAMLLDEVVALHPHALVCVSTWWQDTTKDAMIEAACKAHGGVYVYIGDIFPTRQDVIAPTEDQRIVGHPHDWSMAIIGARVASALAGGV